MTARQIWESLLTELSKVNAPSMLLPDFNYYINKAINQYVNKRYNIYDVNLQTTDDIRVLKSSAILTPVSFEDDRMSDWKAGSAKLFGATYEVYLPLDYLHLLNCICVYKLNSRYKCYNEGDYVQFAAKRLTADSWSTVINDYYNRPLPERPYYYIHNVNTYNDNPTNPIGYPDGSKGMLGLDMKGTDATSDYPATTNFDTEDAKESQLPRRINLRSITNDSLVEKEAAQRYGNTTAVRCEIRYGSDNSVFELQNVMIDYLKAPQFIRLTYEQTQLTQDTSQMMEFPDYVCQEIINELVLLVMENTADPRLKTNIAVSLSIATPTQTLTQPAVSDQQAAQ